MAVKLWAVRLSEFDIPVYELRPAERLPGSFAKLHNGHSGSHQFLVNDFARAVTTRKLPFTNVWFAGRYVTAHESSLSQGDRLLIPDLGYNPDNIPSLDYSDITY